MESISATDRIIVFTLTHETEQYQLKLKMYVCKPLLISD